MKIEGSYQYAFNTGSSDNNSYEKIEEDFEGFINYVDINDSSRLSYYMKDGRYAKIDSSSKNELQGALQERWELICITVRVMVPCNCMNHAVGVACTCDQRGEGWHNPYWDETTACYDQTIFTGQLPAGYTPGTPVYNPTPGSGSGWGSGGGGTPGNPNSGLPPWPFQSWLAYRSSVLYEISSVRL